MASNRKYKWDRLPVEDDLDYSYFLVFRNLGPRRTLRAAYRQFAATFGNAQKVPMSGVNVPDKWKNLRRDNRWVERASAWDVSNLKSVGSQLVVNQSRSLLILSRKALTAAGKVAISTEDARELLEVLKAVQAYLTPEFVGAAGQESSPVPEAVPEVAGSVE